MSSHPIGIGVFGVSDGFGMLVLVSVTVLVGTKRALVSQSWLGQPRPMVLQSCLGQPRPMVLKS